MDYEKDPVGVEQMPQFGWEIESKRKNVIQKSYQLQIALDDKFQQLIYDSGVVNSDASAHVFVQNVSLESASKYYVRVCASDRWEKSEWCQGSFITALLDNKQWEAPFISAETDESYKEDSKGTLVRGNFTISGNIKEAYAFTTALGLYNFYLNGKKVGVYEMTPGWTSYHRHLLYQTYDVTDYLKDGINVAGAMLGAGWYKGVMGLTRARNNYGNQTAFAMQLLIRYEDGREEMIGTGEDWKGADAPVVFSEIYHGEIYDASLEIPDWCIAERPNGSWRDIGLVAFDTSVLRPQSGAQVKCIDTMPAKDLFKTPKGELVIDFGQNMAGRIHVTAKGKKGDMIELRCFEILDGDGNVYVDNLRKARTSMKYIFGKDGQITYHPHFTFMGFRYAVILSYPGVPNLEDFTAYSLHSDMDLTGWFESSNPLLNQLNSNYLWGLKSNFLDVPTDCPQRDERLGWTGDAQIFCRTASYLMNTYTFFKKWLRDLEVDQTEEGGVPHVIPNIEENHAEKNWLLRQGSHSSSAWADAAVIIPWTMYQMYGDTVILERQYESMKKWIDFMWNHSEDYIWNYRLQLGDWVALDAEEGSHFGATPTDLTATAYFAYSTWLFIKASKALGKKVEEYEDLYQNIVKKFQETFFDDKGNMTAQTQTSHIIALYFNLTPENYIKNTVEGLKKLLDKENGHLVTGFIGTPYFCHALSENGYLEDAYDLLLKEDYPSWLYQVKMGATTIWEHWDGIKPDGSMWNPGMNSFNHYAYGAIGEWIYRKMVGIEVDESQPGFKHILISPKIGGNLTYVKGSHYSIYGLISVHWEVIGQQISLFVRIPPNTEATIRLDKAESIIETDGLTFKQADGYMEAKAGSGDYSIVFEERKM